MGRPNICTWFGSNRIIKWGSFGGVFWIFLKIIDCLTIGFSALLTKVLMSHTICPQQFWNMTMFREIFRFIKLPTPRKVFSDKRQNGRKTNWSKFGETTWCWKLHYNVWILIGISQENEKQLKTIKCSPISWSLGHEAPNLFLLDLNQDNYWVSLNFHKK